MKNFAAGLKIILPYRQNGNKFILESFIAFPVVRNTSYSRKSTVSPFLYLIFNLNTSNADVQNTLQQQKSELEKAIDKHEVEMAEQREDLRRIQEDINRQKVRSKGQDTGNIFSFASM
jgi:hypothetical protein